jgi:membrane fusion protein (multidrug efflux system)
MAEQKPDPRPTPPDGPEGRPWPEGGDGTGAADVSPPAAAPPPRRWRSVLAAILLLSLLAVGGVWGARYWRYASAHESTDDAYLTADITSVAPQVTGTITAVMVSENQIVKAGDLLVQLDDTAYRAAVEQSRANLQAAIAQAEGAGITVSLTSETGEAQITQAQGAVQQAEGGIAGAQADLQRTSTAVTHYTAASKEAQANIDSAKAALDAARANRARAQASLEAAQAQLDAAKAAVQEAETGVGAAQADAEQKARDAGRYAALARDGAAAPQEAELIATAAQVARAQVDKARHQVDQARATVTAQSAEVTAAQEQVRATEAAVEQAASALAASRARAESALSDVDQARVQTQVSRENVRQAEARRTQAEGQLHQARTTPRQVALSRRTHEQALAKIAQAQAALTDAETRLSYTRIVAPVDGQVSKKSAEVGSLALPGTPIMAIVQSGSLWTVANFKETQLRRMALGQPAFITVDALGGKRFTGRVHSISAATGATFALLPPENASGNFTRIVQRIPVKIVLDPGQADLDRLRAGMSVYATVQTR